MARRRAARGRTSAHESVIEHGGAGVGASQEGAPPAPAPAGGPAAAALKHAIAHERAQQTGVSLTPSKTKPYWACPEGVCEAIVEPPAAKVAGHWRLPQSTRALEGSGENGGYDPQDLQSAYDIPVSGGEQQQHYEEKQTIALIEVGYDETAESDLAAYRGQYGLSPCTKASGCFREVTERGEEGHPELPDEGWELETSLDLDMASAACPHCHIMLVQANEETLAALARSANSAAKLGATEISNSYGAPELGKEECGASHCAQFAADYNHPGVVVTASAGDGGYDNYLRGGSSPLFPAVSPNVIAVGGTSLHKAKKAIKGRAWSEAVWWEPERSSGTGSGCSTTEPKPSWQKDSECRGRTDNDVAAVGACETPVSIYSSYYGGWINVCGTSVSSPLVAGIEAHAGETDGTAIPTADAFYQERSSLYDVTSGRDGECSPKYLCSAESQVEGYDGPAGNGTPDKGPVAVIGEAPSVRTEPPSVTETLNGVVDSNGLATTYCFEYGTTTSYGTCVPAGEASAGSGTGAKTVSQSLTGLAPALYHYRLVATNADGKSYGEDRILDTAPPTVSDVTPDTGWNIGGTRVKIAGANFIGVTAVRFGSTAVKSFEVISEAEIEAESPAGTGTVDVTVENAGGTSTTVEADKFTYQVLPSPTVAGIAPSAGLSTGETVVTITGTDFAGVSAVDFGSTPAMSFEVISETEIEAISPAGSGVVDVTVTTPSGMSATSAADQFTYEAGSSVGEPAWLSPTNLAVGIPHYAYPQPDVAVDGRGDAAAVWKTCNGSGQECENEDKFEDENEFVEAAFEPAGGSWTVPTRISGLGSAY